MEVLEIGIFILISIIAGFIILGFFIEWDYMGTYKGIQDIFFGNDDLEFERMEVEDLPGELLSFWDRCSKREAYISKSVYLEGTGNFTKKYFFEILKNASLCGTIQSKNHSCGQKETFRNFTSIPLPAIVKIDCYNNTINLQ